MKVTGALKCSAAMALITWLFPAVAFPQYVRTDLTSDQLGFAANTSLHLVNGWGLVQLGTSPFWISDNGTGLSTLYNGLGQLFPTPPQNPLVVEIPPAPGSTQGSPTGVVGNITLGTSNEFKG